LIPQTELAELENRMVSPTLQYALAEAEAFSGNKMVPDASVTQLLPDILAFTVTVCGRLKGKTIMTVS
jgi:hypothetical protein